MIAHLINVTRRSCEKENQFPAIFQRWKKASTKITSMVNLLLSGAKFELYKYCLNLKFCLSNKLDRISFKLRRKTEFQRKRLIFSLFPNAASVCHEQTSIPVPIYIFALHLIPSFLSNLVWYHFSSRSLTLSYYQQPLYTIHSAHRYI